MKNLITNSNAKILKQYVSPTIGVELISLEHSIAAGSAIVNPVSTTGQVREEWETGEDVVGSQIW